MKLFITLGMLLATNACFALGFKPIPDSKYVQVTKSSFDRFVVKDKAVLAKYDHIVFSQLAFDEFTVKPSGNKNIDKTWVISPEDQKTYAESFKEEVLNIYDSEASAQSLFAIGSGKAENTLLAKVQLLSLLPLVAQNGENISGTVMSEKIESFGGLTIRITLVDSVTNEFVAILEDGKDLALSSTMSRVNNRTNNAYIWKKTFHLWLSNLKSNLTDLKTKT